MRVGIEIDPSIDDVEVLIVAQKKSKFVNDLAELIWDYDKGTNANLTGYIGDRAHIIKVRDILRVYACAQKFYIQTARKEYLVKYRLYELEDILEKQKFLRISNSEIVNIQKIVDIDLSITGRVCIRLPENIRTNVSRRYIPKIKKSLGL